MFVLLPSSLLVGKASGNQLFIMSAILHYEFQQSVIIYHADIVAIEQNPGKFRVSINVVAAYL